MTARLSTFLHEYTERLTRAGVFSPAEDAKAILAHALGLPPESIDQHLNLIIDEPRREKAERAVHRREKREPLVRIFGMAKFSGLNIKTAEGVFRPTPESIDLVAHALDIFKDRINEPLRLLDLGTGTGCILLALLRALPNATGLGIDVNGHILEVAQANAEANGLKDRVEFLMGNWGDGIKETFDLIVCNPPAAITSEIPSLDPEMRDYEPLVALDGGKDGLNAYRRLVKAFGRLAKPGAYGVFQVNFKHRESALFQKAGFPVSLKLNYRGKPNCLVVSNKKLPCPVCKILRNLFGG
jgi:release factor glutamine methyltransferase